MEGALPCCEPDRSWSRRDAAKACMAACVSMALQRWIRALVREWRRRARAWRGFGVGEEPEESCGLFTPTSSNFNPEDNEAAPPIPEEFWVRAVPLYCPRRMRGCPARVRGETKVVSTASCAPPHSGRPLAMTSIRLSSWVSTWSMLRSMLLALVVTLAPASLQIRAAARSRGPPRLRKIPAWAQAARWSPKGLSARRHRQKRLVRGSGRRRRRRSSNL